MAQTFPIDTIPTAVLPLLIEARKILRPLASPRARNLEYEINAVLEQIIQVATDVEAYGNKWCSGRMGELADKIRDATREWWEG